MSGYLYEIDMAVIKEEHEADNSGEGTMEIGIRLPNVSDLIKMHLPYSSLIFFFYFLVDFLG